MDYNFDFLPERRHTENFKWRAYPADVLPMFVADMDFVPPEPVVRALRVAVEHGVFGYPRGLHGSADELPEYAGIIVERMARRYCWQIQPEAVVLLPGIVVGLNIVGNMFREQGGSAIVQPPVYPPFLEIAHTSGLTRRDAELLQQPDGTYAIEWERLTDSFAEDTRLFVLCNPHNPVGRVYRRDELERLAEMCLARKVLICSDEIHCDLIYKNLQKGVQSPEEPPHHLPIASLDPAIAQHTITFMAPSKTFNLPGLQASIAIIPNAELRQRFQAARQGLVPWVNVMGLIALEAAYRDGQEWLDQLLVYLEANRDFLYDFVQRELPGISMAKPEGTYLAWLDCRAAQLDNPYEFFLKQAQVALGNGAAFGAGGQGFVRLNFGCPRSMLEEVLQRMKRALPLAG